MVAAAILGAGALGAGASIYSSSQASSAQQSAAAQANATQMAMFQQTQKNLSPYNTAGQNALMGAQGMTANGGFNFNPTMQTLEQTPGYQFNLNQGLKTVQNSAAARGLGTSGAAIRGGVDYASGLASNTYQQQFGNALNQYQANYNNLLGQAQLGEAAAAGQSANGLATGQGIASNTIGAGNAAAAGYLSRGNAISNGANSFASAYGLNALTGGKLFGGGGGDVSNAEAGMYGLSQGMTYYPDGSIG